MESDHFEIREWMRQQVRHSHLTQREISRITGLTEKTISMMMHKDTGTIDTWQRVLNALPHVDRYTLPDAVINVLLLCEQWDKLSKGETATTRTIRKTIRQGLKL